MWEGDSNKRSSRTPETNILEVTGKGLRQYVEKRRLRSLEIHAQGQRELDRR